MRPLVWSTSCCNLTVIPCSLPDSRDSWGLDSVALHIYKSKWTHAILNYMRVWSASTMVHYTFRSVLFLRTGDQSVMSDFIHGWLPVNLIKLTPPSYCMFFYSIYTKSIAMACWKVRVASQMAPHPYIVRYFWPMGPSHKRNRRPFWTNHWFCLLWPVP